MVRVWRLIGGWTRCEEYCITSKMLGKDGRQVVDGHCLSLKARDWVVSGRAWDRRRWPLNLLKSSEKNSHCAAADIVFSHPISIFSNRSVTPSNVSGLFSLLHTARESS